MSKTFTSLAAACAVALALAACGGGGSDSSSGAGGGGTTASPEGAYSGALVGSPVATAVTMLVTETGAAYALYGNEAGGVLYVTGIAIGAGTTSGNSFTSSAVTDYYTPGVPVSATLDATFVQGTSVSGALRYSTGTTVTFSGTSADVAPYVYAQPASLAEAVGVWPVQGLYGQSGTVTVGSTGTFTSNVGGCVSTGTIAPAAGARNYFNVSATAGFVGCATPGVAYTGVATISPIQGSTQKQMITAATSADKRTAVVAFGVK